MQADAGFLKTPRGKGFAWAGPEVKDPKTIGDGTAIGLRKERRRSEGDVQSGVGAVHQDGTFRKLEKQYFDFDIYPGR